MQTDTLFYALATKSTATWRIKLIAKRSKSKKNAGVLPFVSKYRLLLLAIFDANVPNLVWQASEPWWCLIISGAKLELNNMTGERVKWEKVEKYKDWKSSFILFFVVVVAVLFCLLVCLLVCLFGGVVGWLVRILWHINPCRLFNVKSWLYIYISNKFVNE